MNTPNDSGRVQRELTPMQRLQWHSHARAKREAEQRGAQWLLLAIIILGLIVLHALGAILARPAHAGGWGTLPADALRVCFVDDGQWQCLHRVSDFDTLRFCPGTGHRLDEPAPPGLLQVGFTDPATGTFSTVRAQPYQWRQLQAYDGRIVVGIVETVVDATVDGFESCDEYRT